MHCKYCLNPQSISSETEYHILSSHELLEYLIKDELYYVATDGGVAFGGGEPLLYGSYIEEVLELGASRWNTTIETSLNVPLKNFIRLFDYNVRFVVDVKDMTPSIYRDYTGCSCDHVIDNLKWIAKNKLTDKVSVRLPLIPNYNNEESLRQSRKELESMGFNDIVELTYITNIKKYKNERKRAMQYSPCCTIKGGEPKRNHLSASCMHSSR